MRLRSPRTRRRRRGQISGTANRRSGWPRRAGSRQFQPMRPGNGEIGHALRSQRPRVTVSRISPQISDRKASSIRPVASTAVGRRGTRPVREILVDHRRADHAANQDRQQHEDSAEEHQRPFLAHQIADGAQDAEAVALGVELGDRTYRAAPCSGYPSRSSASSGAPHGR